MNDYTLREIKQLCQSGEGLSAEYSVEITKEKIDGFCRLFGSVSPIHTDDEYAQSVGFKGRIVPQLLIVSYILPMIEEHIPGRYGLGLGASELMFRRPVFEGDKLTFRGSVAKVSAVAGMIVIDIEADNQNGDTVLTCKWKAKVLK